MERIVLSVPVVGEAEKQAVLAALDSGWVAPAGPDLDAFETELARAAGRAHAVAVASGTAALHLALLVSGVRPGDWVACSTLTFAASANAIAYCGAEAVFVDCDAAGALDPALLAEALADSAAAGRPISAVLVSDAAESLGSTRDGRPAGSFGDIAAVSFNGNKIISTSSGGAVLTDDPATAARVRHLSTQARQPVPHYEHREIGYNYRLSNLLAALGRAQLRRLDEFVAAKRRHRAIYREWAATRPGVTVLGDPADDAVENCWMTALLLDPPAPDPVAVMEALDARGVDSRPMFKPMHLQPVFSDRAAHPVHGGRVSEDLYRRGLLVPAGPAITDAQCAAVCAHLDSILTTRTESPGAPS